MKIGHHQCTPAEMAAKMQKPEQVPVAEKHQAAAVKTPQAPVAQPIQANNTGLFVDLRV